MLLPLGALTAPHGTRSSVNAGLLARARGRISIASISSILRSVLSTTATYRDSGRMEVLDQYGRSFPHTQRISNWFTARCSHLMTRVDVPVIDAIENGSIDLALRYGISVGCAPRLERLGRTRAAVCYRLQPVSAESDDRHGRA
jgi:hypothetical protein